jgi:hypothetical protein
MFSIGSWAEKIENGLSGNKFDWKGMKGSAWRICLWRWTIRRNSYWRRQQAPRKQRVSVDELDLDGEFIRNHITIRDAAQPLLARRLFQTSTATERALAEALRRRKRWRKRKEHTNTAEGQDVATRTSKRGWRDSIRYQDSTGNQSQVPSRGVRYIWKTCMTP